MQWHINSESRVLPASIVTFAPGRDLGSLPLEVGMLLPTVWGNQIVLDALQNMHFNLEPVAIGIFAADHFLNVNSAIAKLRQAKVNWVCNLPTLAQYESNFQRDLSEVQLTIEHEITQLTVLRDAGLKIMLVVSQRIDPSILKRLQPDAIAFIPALPEFINGFPSLTRRKELEAEIVKDLLTTDYAGPVLYYRERSEKTDHPCLCRPALIQYADLAQT